MIVSDNEYTYSKEYDMKWYEVDSKAILKPSSLLNHLQDIATKSADKFGIGMSFLAPKNYAWFLIKYHMDFYDYPQSIDSFILKTESRGCSRLFATRDFEMWSNDEKCLLGRISSQWAMINLADKSFVKLSDIGLIPPFEKRDDDIIFSKVNAQDAYDYEKKFEIRYDDIDINQHVNNSNYIVWAMEALPVELRKNYKPKTIDMIYKKDIAYGDSVVSRVRVDNEKTSHLLINEQTNDQLCLIDVVWEKI